MPATTRLPTTLLSALRTSSRTTPTLRQRCYHSYDYAHPPPFPPAETAILSSAYAHVPAHGFTIDALKLGARDAGYLDVSTNLLPRGVFDLINYHLVTQRLALASSVQFSGDKPPSVGSKVRSLTLARLRANEPVLHRWQEVFPPRILARHMLIRKGPRHHGPALVHPALAARTRRPR